MAVLAVIPAMKTRILRPLAGRPLLAHTIDQARIARRITRVVVLTTSDEVAAYADRCGADVEKVSLKSVSNTSPAAILALASDEISKRDGFLPQAAIVLDPNYPLRSPGWLDRAIDFLFQCGADSLVSVEPLTEPLWVRDASGLAQSLELAPSEKRYAENGAVQAMRASAFESGAGPGGGRVVLFETPPFEGLHVTSVVENWRGAEALVRRFHGARAASLFKSIKLLALDFDGVITDNRVLVFQDGREAVVCSRGDGYGFDLLRTVGVPVVVISKEGNPVVSARCQKLKIPCEQGVGNKLPVLQRYADEHQVGLEDIAFMGNDLNDMECLRACGLAIAPADAQPEVLRIATLVTAASGGVGAVREVCDLIVQARTAESDAISTA